MFLGVQCAVLLTLGFGLATAAPKLSSERNIDAQARKVVASIISKSDSTSKVTALKYTTAQDAGATIYFVKMRFDQDGGPSQFRMVRFNKCGKDYISEGRMDAKKNDKVFYVPKMSTLMGGQKRRRC